MWKFILSPAIVMLVAANPGPVRGKAVDRSAKPDGRQAVASARQDWKRDVGGSLKAGLRQLGDPRMVPRRFWERSALQRLAYLRAIRASETEKFDRLNPFLGRLLEKDSQIRVAADQSGGRLNGLLPNTPLVRALRHRRGLNSRRFDHFHPTLGAILERDRVLRSRPITAPSIIVPPVAVAPPDQNQNVLPPPGAPDSTPPGITPPGVTPPGVTPPGGTPGSGGGGGDGPGQVVIPEPASMAMMLVGGASLLARRILRKKRPA